MIAMIDEECVRPGKVNLKKDQKSFIQLTLFSRSFEIPKMRDIQYPTLMVRIRIKVQDKSRIVNHLMFQDNNEF